MLNAKRVSDAGPESKALPLQDKSKFRKRGHNLIRTAVLKNKAYTKRGILERMFTMMFKGFVYPQIWEDPELDMEVMDLQPHHRIMTIASGGCNVLNYLTASPAEVHAVDINPAHISLMKLKLAGLQYLPDYESFFTFFGKANTKANIEAYKTYLKPHLDEETLKYWESRTPRMGRRINFFKNNIYKHGLLGHFISTVHTVSKMHGQNPKELVTATTMEEQLEIFNRTLNPIFDKKLIRSICNMPVSLYGLGIPPAQYDALSEDAKSGMADLLRARLKRLACDFPIQDNYFAWQAFNRGYDFEHRRAVPRYLSPDHFDSVKAQREKVHVHHESMTDFLASQDDSSMDRYVLLDAQDWMNEEQLNALWNEITRTARTGARVIFRTAGTESCLTGKLSQNILDQWDYDAAACAPLIDKDRSSIYGGFHMYELKG